MMPNDTSQLPAICGADDAIAATMDGAARVSPPASTGDSQHIQSAFAIALHMHQPLIPAGGGDLSTAPIISNLAHMLADADSGARYNADVFRQCYSRMGQFIPQLVHDGHRPRVMLDYSGCLLHGLALAGADDVLDSLKAITCQPMYQDCVEWVGSAWGHPVAPSTPVQDYRLHVRAWQHHFASIFGHDALCRVRGFSPAEMALPNHPDVCYDLVKTLKDCGYRWLLVQEHTVETLADGGPIQNPHIPHRLLATNSRGQTLSITAIIKTQGSDTKLVGQMQPYYQAKGVMPVSLAGRLIPPLVTQVADGENGGVMMNEFPSKFHQVMIEASASPTPPMNITQYLEHLNALGIADDHFPPVRPIMQKRLWDRFPTGSGPDALAQTIKSLEAEPGRFHMDGGSWTGNISWVKGYGDLLGPMESASALFAQKVLSAGIPTTEARYRNALYHLLLTQTSCFRYWGQGAWTDYGRELCRRTTEIIHRDF